MAKKEIPQLQVQPRERTGSRYAARLRKEGQLPAVVYGHKEGPVSISLDYRQFHDILHEGAHLIELTHDGGKTEACLVRDVQWDYLGIDIVHADFSRVDLTEEVEVSIDIELVGEPQALQEAGAVLDHPTPAVDVSCRADAIPDRIVVNIDDLGADDVITLADIALPEGVTAVSDPDTVIARIGYVAEVEEEVEEEAAAGEEPEVIGRAAEEEGGEEA
ncbi:MAG: 50S ribosomal protein L25 [Phycisphaeraceae bacterium]